jgi:hypothetical protein
MSIIQLITSNFTDFHLDLHFSVMFVGKANIAEEETARDM